MHAHANANKASSCSLAQPGSSGLFSKFAARVTHFCCAVRSVPKVLTYLIEHYANVELMTSQQQHSPVFLLRSVTHVCHLLFVPSHFCLTVLLTPIITLPATTRSARGVPKMPCNEATPALRSYCLHLGWRLY